jgi:hypothetical protein
MKRFSAKKQRPLYHKEQESWEADENHEQLEGDWEDDHAEDDYSVNSNFLAFQLQLPCISAKEHFPSMHHAILQG